MARHARRCDSTALKGGLRGSPAATVVVPQPGGAGAASTLPSRCGERVTWQDGARQMTDTAWEPLRDLPRGTAGLERAARALRQASSRHTSVYLYGLEGETLVLRAFEGRPTDHTRIRVGEGVCGRAVASGGSQLVADVVGDPDYISCSLETRSECVVLIRRDGRVVGQIDIDSDVPDAFTPEDVIGLEKAADLLAPLL